MLWSSDCGGNVQLDAGYRSARRRKSYDSGVLVSSLPLPSDKLFQCVVKEVDRNWSGTLSLGVTTISPRHACLVDKAQELKKRSYVICTEHKVTCLYIGGKEVCKLPNVSLASLEEGGTVGILCKRTDRTLHFFVNHTHLEIKLPEGEVRLPSTRYALVDLYGQHCAVELLPLRDVDDGVKYPDESVSIDRQDLSHVKRHLKPHKSKNRQQEQPTMGATNQEQCQQPCHHQNGDALDQQIHPESVHLSSEAAAVSDDRQRVADVSPNGSTPSLLSNGMPVRSYQQCGYYKLCRAFLGRLSVPGEYLSPEAEHSKCYCPNCLSVWGEPKVKFSGDPQKKYAVAHGWVKFGLRMTFGPQADKHRSFERWHKAYHGTSPGRVRPILDNGGLMLPGSCLLGGVTVEQPPGHYNDHWKPPSHDPHQIFVSPSIQYCSFHDVYAKKHRFEFEGQAYEGRVCFKVLIEPKSYEISAKTVATCQGEVIDEEFSDTEMEWSTKSDRAVYIYALMTRIDKT